MNICFVCASAGLKGVRGSFAILFWLPCATWHRVMTHTHHTWYTIISIGRRFFFATRRQGRYPRSLEAFIFTPVDFLSVSRHDARAPLERTKDVDFRRAQFFDRLNDAWKRGMDQEETSTTSIDRRAGEWVHGREPLLSCSLRSSVWFFLFVLVDLGSEQSLVYYGGGGLQLKTPVGADNVSSMSIWWVYSQSASQHFFGSVVLQSSFSLSCTYALGEWSVVSHRWSRRTPAGFCIWSNQWGYFTERGRKNWTFTKSELLLHRHEAAAPALAKQNLYAISMHSSWRT